MTKAQMKYRRTYQPQSRQKKQDRSGFKKFKTTLSWILFLTIIFSYILFYSPLFKISEVRVYNNKAVKTEDIKISLNELSQNIFLISKQELTDVITQGFPRIVSVKVEKNIFTRKLELKITERKEVGILCEKVDNKCYYLDKDGVLFEEAPQTSGTLILIINDFSEKEIIVGEAFISQELINELTWVREYLFKSLEVSALDFEIGLVSPNDLKVNTYAGWYILLDKSKNIKNQLEALKLVLEKKIGEGKEDLKYIDLRIENRAYYK